MKNLKLDATAPTGTIAATGITPATVCAGGTTTVSFTYTGSPTSITGLLSNASGTFGSGTTPLSGTATTSAGSGSIPLTIPASVAGGTGYKIRVNASGITGTGDQAVTINNVAVTPAATQTISVNTNGNDLTATETPAANFTSREWYYGTTSGSYPTATGVTGATYTPNFATIGTYYVVAKSTFATCGPLTSNEVQINVTAPTPTITVSPAATLTFGATNAGTPSAEQFYTVRGDNLTASIAVTAPTGYEISLTSGAYTGTGANTLTLPQTGGSVAPATIYVRLTGTGTGTVAGNIAHTSTGAATRNVAVTGTIMPVVTTSTAGPLTFATTGGAVSTAQSYTVSGAGLTASLVVTAPTGYAVSQTSATSGFATTQTLTQTGGSVATTTVYVRLTGAGVGTVAGTVANASTGATTQNVAVTGTITPVITVSTAGPLTFSTIAGTASTPQNYTVSGAGLSADIVLNAPSGYEISKTSATASYATTQTLTPSSGSVSSTTVYIRLAATAAVGPYGTAGTPVQLTHTSPGATQKDIDLVGTVAPQPTITVTPASLSSFSTTVATPSAAQAYTLSGTDLTGAVTVTAPAGYEVSQTSPTTAFAASQTVTVANATAPGLSIYVRLTGAAIGTFGTAGTPVNVTNASASAVTKNVVVNGSVVAAPTLATYSLAALTTGRAATAPATGKDANIGTAADLTRGAGLSTSGVSTSPDIFGASGWGTVGSLADAQANDKYFAFAVTPVFGYLANVSSIGGNAYRTSTAPNTIELLYSTNSDFSSPASLGIVTITSTLAPGQAFSFPTNGALQNVAVPIYFRLYGYGSTSTSANFYFSENGSAPGLVVNGTTAATTAPLIATGAVSPTAVCGGSNVVVSYTTAGPAAAGTYQVQLSNATGSFASPVTLATVSSTGTSLTATVPGTTPSGTAYKVRVVNTDGTLGTASAALTVVTNPTATIAPASAQALNVGTPGVPLTVTETPAAVSRQWAYATTPGGSYAAISGATGTSYTPSFPTAGTYYVVVQSTFAACGTVTSAEVAVTVTTPTLTATPAALTGLTTNTGAASAPRTYVLGGTGVLAAVTVTAPAGYEVSVDGSSYSASVSAPAAGVNAGQTVYVRLLGTTTGSVSGNVTNTVGTTTVSVAVSGDVLTPPGLLLVEDDFDYTGQLVANGWTGNAISATIAGNIVVPTYPQGQLATGATSRQASIDGGSGNDLYRSVTVPAGATTLYAAALINVGDVSNVSATSGDYLFAFRTAGTTSYRGRVTIANVSGSNPARFTFKIRAAGEGTATVQSTPTQFNVNTDYVLVMKAEHSAATGNADRFSLYVLPSGANLSQEPGAPLLSINGVNEFSNIGSFFIHTSDSNNPVFKMDNFRVATGWGTAVGNAVYNAPTAAVNAGSYYSLSANNVTQLTQAGAVTVENQLALPSGNIDLNGQRLTLAGTVTGPGALAGSATSSLTVLGTGALGTLNFAAGAQTLNNLTLNRTGSGAATLGTPLTVNGSLVLTSGALTTSATNLLTLATAASVTPTVAASGPNVGYVDGPVARPVPANTAATSFVFPVGKSSSYRPLTLNVTSQGSVATVYRAEQVDGNPGQSGTDPLATDGTTLTRVSRVRSFSLTPYDPANPGTVLQPTGFNGTVALSFDADDRVNLPNVTTLVIAKRSASSQPWTNINRTGNTASTVISGTFGSFSDFALASTDALVANNPLPVQLSSFGAQRQAGKTVAVKWTTASEKNADRFDVQRSFNAHDFTTVTTTKAQGTSSKATAYAVLDQTAPAGTLYYRLRQVDLDGTVAYSPVVTIAGLGETAKVLLYPNPTRSSLSFVAEAATPYRVLNRLGQPLLQGTTESGTAKIGVEALPVGLYFLELQTGTGRVVQKFEKE